MTRRSASKKILGFFLALSLLTTATLAYANAGGRPTLSSEGQLYVKYFKVGNTSPFFEVTFPLLTDT